MSVTLEQFILLAGIGQLGVLIASALVPIRLNWQHEFQTLSKLHRQMYWVYGGYVVMSIVAFALISILMLTSWQGGVAWPVLSVYTLQFFGGYDLCCRESLPSSRIW